MSESKIEMLLSKFELYSASYANTGEERFFSKVNEVRAQIVEEDKRLREALNKITDLEVFDGKSREHYQSLAAQAFCIACKALEGDSND